MALEGTWFQSNPVASPQCYTRPPCLVLYHPTQGYVLHHGQLYLKDVSITFKPDQPNRSYAGLWSVLSNGLACHMLVSVCLLSSNLNVHTNQKNSDCHQMQVAFEFVSWRLKCTQIFRYYVKVLFLSVFSILDETRNQFPLVLPIGIKRQNPTQNLLKCPVRMEEHSVESIK